MAQTKPEFEATSVEKLLIPFGILGNLFASLCAVFTAPFRGSSGAATYKSHIGHYSVRNIFSILNRAQMHIANTTGLTPRGYLLNFVSTYKKWCQKNGQQPDIDTLKSGAQVFWMGERDAKYVCLYFHGGGYSIDGSAGHLLWWHSVQQDLAAASKSMAVCFVSYTLVPHETYPKQFQECADALEYLLTKCNRKPSEVIISGDSAGGNMCLAILSHLSKPSPDVPEIKITEPLKAAIPISPWVSFSTDWPSWKRNYYKDIIYLKCNDPWAADYVGGHVSDIYTEPIKAPTEFWRGAKTERMLCVSGTDEVLVDSIDEWVEKYRAANPDSTTYVKAINEIHVHPILYSNFTTETGQQGEAIKSFLKSNL